jgi:tetratricopeptide (TPR) repeat protein
LHFEVECRLDILSQFGKFAEIELMVERVKMIKKSILGNTGQGKGTRPITQQRVIERSKPHVGEIIIFSLVIFFLASGTYWRNRVWNSEIKLWTDCVMKSPKKDRPHNNLGNVFLKQGKYEEAAAHYNEALRINPNYADAHYNLGNALARQGKTQDAVAHYTEALRIKPNFAEAHNNLGTLLAKEGKVEEAAAHYNEALRIKPDYAEARYSLGILLAQQGRQKEAMDHFFQGLGIEVPGNLGIGQRRKD